MVLTSRTVEALVTALRRKDKAATVFAIESKVPWGGRPEIDVDGRRTQVREARSPLRLREVLHEARGNDDLVILTDLDSRAFGRENLAKVALRRIEPVQPWPVVRLLFGVASVDPRLVRHAWMAERLLSAQQSDRVIPTWRLRGGSCLPVSDFARHALATRSFWRLQPPRRSH